MKTSNLPALLLALAALSAMADPATGWKQTAAGTYDYNDAANWVNGDINGVFGSDLTLAGAQTITFAADTTLPNGLTFAYKGNYAVTLQSEGAGDKTLTLGGDVTCSVSAGVNVYTSIAVDNTTITLANCTWNQYGKISGGAFSVVGGAGGNSFFRCHSAENDFTGDITVSSETTFCYLAFQTDGALPDDVTILLTGRGCIEGAPSAGYACGTLLANGRIDPASTGGIAFVNTENVDVDLTGYPSLFLATSGNNNYYGHITPANGLYHFCSPYHVYLGAENALTGTADVLVDHPNSGTSLYLDNRNDVSGTVSVVGCGLILRKDAGSLPNADVHVYGGNFYINSDKNTGTRRAEYVHLHGGTLTCAGNKSYATTDSVGELVLDVRDPSYGVIGGACSINLLSNCKTAKLHVEQFTRTNNAVWRMGGSIANNRLRVGGADGENTVQFTVGNSAEIIGQLVGGGGAPGTTTISVYPFGLANVNTYYDSLLTYGSTGFRALDYEMEFATSITPGTVSQDNVRLPVGSTTEITSDTTVNAVFLQGSDPNNGSTYLTGSGTLALTSGVLVMGYHRNAQPVVQCAAVNFGNRPGVISYPKGKGSTWQSALKGTAGAIFFQFADSASTGSGGTGVTISGENAAASTITGDIVMHGNVNGNADGTFPGGANRPGNLYVNAYCNLLDGDGFNGIYGIGNLYRDKVTTTIVVGADGSNGNFEGFTSPLVSLVKNGAGRQRIGGVCTHSSTTTVNAGVLQVDGSFTASAVTVNAGATLGGVGSFDKSVTVADGALLEAGSAQIAYQDDHALDFGNTLALSGAATLRVHVYGKDSLASVNAAAVTGSGTVTVAMDSPDYTGTFPLVVSQTALPCTFAKGANCGGLNLRNGGKELWVSHFPATLIILQ